MTTVEQVNTVLAQLEAQQIYLSQYGNNGGQGSLADIQKYHVAKRDGIFSLVEIDKIRLLVRRHCKPSRRWNGSYGLKHDVERIPGARYVANGDCILAMILEGYEYKFRKNVRSKTGPSYVNAEIKCVCEVVEHCSKYDEILSVDRQWDLMVDINSVNSEHLPHHYICELNALKDKVQRGEGLTPHAAAWLEIMLAIRGM